MVEIKKMHKKNHKPTHTILSFYKTFQNIKKKKKESLSLTHLHRTRRAHSGDGDNAGALDRRPPIPSRKWWKISILISIEIPGWRHLKLFSDGENAYLRLEKIRTVGLLARRWLRNSHMATESERSLEFESNSERLVLLMLFKVHDTFDALDAVTASRC